MRGRDVCRAPGRVNAGTKAIVSSRLPEILVVPREKTPTGAAARPARGAGTLIPSAQRFVWAAKQALVKAALGALFA